MLAASAMSEQPANVRVRQRITEWTKQHGHGSQRALAQAVPAKFGEPRSDSWISDIIAGRADLTLRDLDAVADHLGVPPGELVRRHDRQYLELRHLEARMVAYVRTLPERVVAGLSLFVEYLLKQPPAEQPKPKAGWIHPEDEAAYRRRNKLPK